MQKLSFLGHVVDECGLHVDPKKIEAVQNFRRPAIITEMRSVLGLASFYRRFIKGFLLIVDPMHWLLSKGEKFIWQLEQEKSFPRIKEKLCEFSVLARFVPNADIVIRTDASGFAIGASLNQNKHAVAFISSCLSKGEQNYGISEKECLVLC